MVVIGTIVALRLACGDKASSSDDFRLRGPRPASWRLVRSNGISNSDATALPAELVPAGELV